MPTPSDPPAISQSYYIGTREPGDTVIPVRMVLDASGGVIVRCVGLRDGGRPCMETWVMDWRYPGTSPQLASSVATVILTHMRLFHGQR